MEEPSSSSQLEGLAARCNTTSTSTSSSTTTSTTSSGKAVARTRFGQLVIGPPGAGKTTYVAAMAELLRALGRKVAIVNLDPGNENMSYTADIEVGELVRVEEVMDRLGLGPNGALVYCMQFLVENYSWLEGRLAELPQGAYLLIDCPGQVELYTVDDSVRSLVERLVAADTRLAAVHLVDSHYCSDPAKFISVCLTSLTTMLQVALPHVNLLSKVDLVERFGKLQFNLDYYTEVLDLEYLLDTFPEDPFTRKHKALHTALTGLVADYSLVNFLPVTVKSKERMVAASQAIDKANGYVFGVGEERSLRALLGTALGGADFEWAKTAEAREYMEEGETLGNDLDNLDIDPQFQV